MKLTIEIDMGNAAFDGRPATEAIRILREVEKGLSEGEDGGPAIDANGNTVGHWTITD